MSATDSTPVQTPSVQEKTSTKVEEQKPVIENRVEEIKHPLQNKWVLWFDNPKKKQAHESWEENLKRIYTFDTVEDFWCLINNIQVPTRLSTGSNYHLFKDGIRPMWEDPINMKGGKWIFTSQRQRRNKVDDAWLHTLLALIGETMDDNEDICGAVVSIRKSQDRISIWTKTANDETLQKAIGKKFREVLDLPRPMVLKYQAHADAAASGSSFLNQVHYEA